MFSLQTEQFLVKDGITATELSMKHTELDSSIKAKTVELELAMEFGKPKEELLKLYKQLKELHYEKLSLEQAGLREGRDLQV
jgi:hypothetical protein